MSSSGQTAGVGPHKACYAATALVLGLTAALTLLELGLRVAAIPTIEMHRRGPVTGEDHRRFFAYDADLGWRGRPNERGPFRGWEFTTQVQLNEWGFRDAGPWRDKQPGQHEILLLGDSITWGYGVEEGRRYSDLLPAELAKAGIDAVVRNVAVPGYDTGLELLLYRQLRGRGCPDLVLIGLYENDIRENVSPSQGPYAKPYFRSVDGRLQPANVPVPADGREDRHANTEEGWSAWMRAHVRLYAGAAWIKETARQLLEEAAPMTSEPDPRGVAITAALLHDWAGEVERDRRQAAVILLPDAEELAKAGASTTDLAATESGVRPVLRLAAAFREAAQASAGPLFYRLDGAHWTEAAHALAARHLARLMVEAGLFQRAPNRCAAA